MCLPKILFRAIMLAFIFLLTLISTLLSAMKCSCFSSNEIRLLCCQSLALVLFSVIRVSVNIKNNVE